MQIDTVKHNQTKRKYRAWNFLDAKSAPLERAAAQAQAGVHAHESQRGCPRVTAKAFGMAAALGPSQKDPAVYFSRLKIAPSVEHACNVMYVCFYIPSHLHPSVGEQLPLQQPA